MTVEVLSLQGGGCVDARRVGDKAARLSAAWHRGLPVLAGVVLPTDVSATLLDSAATTVAAHGLHVGRLAVMESASPDLSALPSQVAALGDQLVVRSSSPLEADALYSGAFSSYLGVSASEAATAVRGVWSSALTDRGADTGLTAGGTDGSGPRMAVLVQPLIDPVFSGTASVVEGAVRVVAVRGSPAPLLAGWSTGAAAEVSAEGHVSGADALSVVGAALIGDVAALARRVCDLVGDDLIEWAATDEGVVILQAKRAAPLRPSPPRRSHTRSSPPAAAAGVARLVNRFAGTLGDELILPVLLAGVGPATDAAAVDAVTPADGAAARAAWMVGRLLAESLRRRSWAGLDGDGGGAASALAQLRSGDIHQAVDRLASLPAPPPEAGDRLLRLMAVVAAWLQQMGALISREDFWTLAPTDIVHLLAAPEASPLSDRRDERRRALLRWEPFVYDVVRANGTALAGEAVSPGLGAGPAVVVNGLPSDVLARPRMVLVAPYPIPQLAPLLWGASALVTAGGSASAHLVEVARSLGVAAVVGCDDRLLQFLGDASATDTLVAVDGDEGNVSVDVRAEAALSARIPVDRPPP